jgi:hypothetical protein
VEEAIRFVSPETGQVTLFHAGDHIALGGRPLAGPPLPVETPRYVSSPDPGCAEADQIFKLSSARFASD